MEIRINLSQVDFRNLVQGKEVAVKMGETRTGVRSIDARIILDDIGFQAMTAEVNNARRLVEEKDRREALAKGVCRFCGNKLKGPVTVSCSACGRLQ